MAPGSAPHSDASSSAVRGPPATRSGIRSSHATEMHWAIQWPMVRRMAVTAGDSVEDFSTFGCDAARKAFAAR